MMRLLAGPDFSSGPERYAAHTDRLGEVPLSVAGTPVIRELQQSGLLGRGGAGYPVGAKWEAVARRSRRRGRVIANGAEGEPRSAKDQALLALRPHLVLDGAVLAALSVGADAVRVYVGTEHRAAVDAVARALDERPEISGLSMELVEAPTGYVAGESSAVVRYLSARDPRPTSGPRPHEAGGSGPPSLVQNVESLAHAALIARYGAAWYREAGRTETRGTALVTVTGPLRFPGVREIEYGTTLGDVIDLAGGLTEPVHAVLVGGYFGGWSTADRLMRLPLDPAALRHVGLAFGCGLIGLLPAAACPVRTTYEIVSYMAAESARQCGPCVFGLGAMADALARLSRGAPLRDDAANLARWSREIVGRGACHLPDGTAALISSAMREFADDFAAHGRSGCRAGLASREGAA